MGPRLINVDFALYKDFTVREKYKIDLRGEAFNLMNRADFGNPGTNVSTPATFGVISSLLVTPLPRNVQVSMRVTF